MKKLNIAIVGLGNIGRRHLESFFRSSYSMNIHIIEIDEVNISIGKEIAKLKAKTQHKIYFHKKLPKNLVIDFLLLATTSQNRFDIASNIINRNKVLAVIFEKVVFQKPDDYEKMATLLDSHQIDAWINNWPRLAQYNQEIKTRLASSSFLEMEVSGMSS